MIVCNPLHNSLLLVGAQVWETWLTCFCWHVTWDSWIISIEIARKCLFNKRFSSFYFHLCLLRKSKVLFARAQVLEMWLTCFCWHVTWKTWIVSIEIVRKCLFNTHFSSFYFHLCYWEIQKSCLPALRYATHWFLVFGMWLSGGYHRTIRHDYRL